MREQLLCGCCVCKTVRAAVFCMRWSFAMLDAKKSNRSELAQSRRERAIAVAMDSTMSSARKERMCLRATCCIDGGRSCKCWTWSHSTRWCCVAFDDRRSGSTVAPRSMSRTRMKSTSSLRTLIRTSSRTPSGRKRKRMRATDWRLKQWKKKWRMTRRQRSKYEEWQTVKLHLL